MKTLDNKLFMYAYTWNMKEIPSVFNPELDEDD